MKVSDGKIVDLLKITEPSGNLTFIESARYVPFHVLRLADATALYYGLYVSPMNWRELDNFSSGSVCLFPASNLDDEHDDYRDYNAYLTALEANKLKCRYPNLS